MEKPRRVLFRLVRQDGIDLGLPISDLDPYSLHRDCPLSTSVSRIGGLRAPDDPLESSKISAKGGPTLLRCARGRVRLSSAKLLRDLHIASFFQHSKMGGEIPVGETQRLLQKAEIGFTQGQQRGHDSQPRFLMDGLIQRFQSETVNGAVGLTECRRISGRPVP